MYYGNTLKNVKAATLVGFAIGVFADVAAIIGISAEGRWSHAHPWVLLPLGLGPAVLLGLIVSLTAMFGVKVQDGRIQRLLFGRFVLWDVAVSDVRSIQFGGGGP